MTYTVKEIFYTLQGEGAHAGRPAVFCRFTGCNLWTGREEDRASAICQFCDTDFVGVGPGGGKFRVADDSPTPSRSRWPSRTGTASASSSAPAASRCSSSTRRAIDALHERGFEVAIETNGTLEPPAGHRLDLRQPEGRRRDRAEARERAQARLPAAGRAAGELRADDFDQFFLQPMDGPDLARNTHSRSSTASRTRTGGSACRPTSSSGSADGSRRHPRTPRSIALHPDRRRSASRLLRSSRSSPSRRRTASRTSPKATSAPACTATRSGSTCTSRARSIPRAAG